MGRGGLPFFEGGPFGYEVKEPSAFVSFKYDLNDSVRLFSQGMYGVSESNRRAKFYELTRAGRKQVHLEAAGWARTVDIMSRFLEPTE